MSEPKKAVALISGGLDSMLAARVIMEQGIQVEGINFFTGFCVEGHTHAIRKKDKNKQKRNNALWSAEQLGIKLHIVDIIDEYKDVLINPKHGYGAHMNPCLDCKIFMVNKAKQWIQENGFDFIITGEVIGQRPMSQRRETMPIVAAESGADDLLLRPLCAKNLPMTLPEREGWVDREKLYDFSGRSRKPQMALAEAFGFEDYAQPAGGCCFLTDEHYSKKLVDLWQARGKKEYDLDDVMLLKVGRHIRPKNNFKLIVAREEGEARFMQGYKNHFINMNCVSHRGPLVLIDGEPSEDDLILAGQITARYGQGRNADEVTLQIREKDKAERMITVKPLKADEIPEEWFV
ncbi:tRNA (5-methylaminomethyl-2-thiouridylate)-methyltransferase [methane-oxidizing endosymbiont of Gigantopelta aegis]|uniref:tRNA (5-methylaminomethyl-2-thiouridylate)-methyltransferase n=1 Tax=methane-oxidizing endosymbiont of Gigantopelta aegis TaxID=2794938 RepID=UPI0018DC3E76|nr:tRNA (5-methylaminomethyl-2-thiouridylate)-methyltransferase [methane-oxidizing endosymbiont of Gigantopelta aegis]